MRQYLLRDNKRCKGALGVVDKLDIDDTFRADSFAGLVYSVLARACVPGYGLAGSASSDVEFRTGAEQHRAVRFATEQHGDRLRGRGRG